MSAGFDAARRAAVMSDLLAVLAGRPTDLLPFEPVRRVVGEGQGTDLEMSPPGPRFRRVPAESGSS